MQESIIRIENLSKYYGDTCAVDQISFEIKRGEILGLLGPNGAGKTTTMRILTCYLQPTSGDVSVKEFNIYDYPVEVKKLIGYLPESAPLYPDMLVYDYLSFVADVREIDRSRCDARIRELAGMCGISEVMHRPISELSKGYKQRVGLAHAMMNDPEILVLDEPTSGLDPNQIVEIREIIRKIGREKTVVLSTHILSEAEATCDRIIIINRGRIVADGATDQLKQRTGSDCVIQVCLRGINFEEVKKVISVLSGVKDVVLNSSEDGEIHIGISCSGTGDMRPVIYGAIKDNGWSLLEFHRETRTLENIFRELTKGE